MTAIAIYLLASFIAFYLLWIFYLAVMNLKRVQDTVGLNKTCLYLGMPVLVIGLVLDLVVNTFVMSVILLEMPEETTVTARLKRHKIESTGYRLKVVEWFETVLDAFDPSGDHV
tara:strand:- start:143 stop:484 length:342 start_codon:yes stop_codon:yes gene_type:complete